MDPLTPSYSSLDKCILSGWKYLLSKGKKGHWTGLNFGESEDPVAKHLWAAKR